MTDHLELVLEQRNTARIRAERWEQAHREAIEQRDEARAELTRTEGLAQMAERRHSELREHFDDLYADHESFVCDVARLLGVPPVVVPEGEDLGEHPGVFNTEGVTAAVKAVVARAERAERLPPVRAVVLDPGSEADAADLARAIIGDLHRPYPLGPPRWHERAPQILRRLAELRTPSTAESSASTDAPDATAADPPRVDRGGAAAAEEGYRESAPVHCTAAQPCEQTGPGAGRDRDPSSQPSAAVCPAGPGYSDHESQAVDGHWRCLRCGHHPSDCCDDGKPTLQWAPDRTRLAPGSRHRGRPGVRLRVHDDGRIAIRRVDGLVWICVSPLTGVAEVAPEPVVDDPGWREAVALPLTEAAARRLAQAMGDYVEVGRYVLDRLAAGTEGDR